MAELKSIHCGSIEPSSAGFAEQNVQYVRQTPDEERFAQSVALMQSFSLIGDAGARQRLIEIARGMANE